MKFVYVLSSSEKDFLTEQAMVSMYSLKMHDPEAQILLCVDKETYDGLDEGRARIKDYADEIKVFDLPEELLPIQKSRYIKTSLRLQKSHILIFHVILVKKRLCLQASIMPPGMPW